MDIFTKIRKEYDAMSGVERKVADLIMDNPTLVEKYTITQISEMAGTSTAAVQRFCAKCGCSGFKQFHYEISSALQKVDTEVQSSDIFTNISRDYASAVAGLAEIDRDSVNALLEDITKADRVILLGQYRNSIITAKAAMNLTDLSIPAFTGSSVLEDAHLLHLATPDTCVVIFSVIGEIHHYREIMDDYREATGHKWLITCNPRAKLSAMTDHTLLIPSSSASHSTGIDEHVLMLACIEILNVMLKKKLQQ